MKANPLLAALRKVEAPKANVPAGFKSTVQWAAEWDVGRLTAGRYIAAGVSAGLMECRRFRIHRVDGQNGIAPFYRELAARSR